VVSTSLATGTRQLARRRVLVKRLVCIEDLGDMDMLVTDKTGTLTDGNISFSEGLPVDSALSTDGLIMLGLLATELDYEQHAAPVVGRNPLDAALWAAAVARGLAPEGYERLDLIPFDHVRRMTSALLRTAVGTIMLVTKGAPEEVLRRCRDVPETSMALLER
jgi:Mg2+-importing ATPase